MNNLSAIGGIGKDAVLKYTANGDPICNFSFALTSGYGDKQITTWLNCSLFGKRAETLSPMLLKGTKIGVDGQLTNRPYMAKDGSEKLSLELRVNDVTLVGAKSDAPVQKSGNVAVDPMDDVESDIPF